MVGMDGLRSGRNRVEKFMNIHSARLFALCFCHPVLRTVNLAAPVGAALGDGFQT